MAEPTSAINSSSAGANILPFDAFPPWTVGSPSAAAATFRIQEGRGMDEARRSGLELVRQFDLLSLENAERGKRLKATEVELEMLREENRMLRSSQQRIDTDTQVRLSLAQVSRP
jgi:hypothetical protein